MYYHMALLDLTEVWVLLALFALEQTDLGGVRMLYHVVTPSVTAVGQPQTPTACPCYCNVA